MIISTPYPTLAAVGDDISADYRNAIALAEKLQHLLDASRRECDALRERFDRTIASAPDLETAPLEELIEAVSTNLREGQMISISPRGCVGLTTLGQSFAVHPSEMQRTLDASAHLLSLLD